MLKMEGVFMPTAHTKKPHIHPLRSHPLVRHVTSPLGLIIAAFLVGFCTHLIISSIFAESSADVIHACVRKNGDVRIILNFKDYRDGKKEKERRDFREDKNGCQENETAMTWNVQGPAGPTGTSSGGGGNTPFICVSCEIFDLLGDRLVGKDLSNALLKGTELSKANLSGVNFSNAFLDSVSFVETNLSRVNFENADLRNANLEKANLENVTWKNTICPDGTNSNDHNNTCDGHLIPQE